MNARRALAVVLGVLAVGRAIRALAARRVDDLPLSPLFARGRVGADWARRRGLEAAPAAGEVDDFGVYDREGFDASAVHPEVRRFYERTGEYDLAYRTTWHRGFRTGAWLASFATGWLEQLALPGRSGGGVERLESRIARVPDSADPRGSRVWTRVDPDAGTAVFVATYATHGRAGVTYANVAVPLPRSNLSAVLRPGTLGAGDATGVRFTTRDDGDGGLYLVTPVGALPVPLEQSFRVWPAGALGAPRAPGSTVPDLVASHDMWLLGRRFLTVRYAIARPDP